MVYRHLLVLGNGFDLLAEVPTSFNKFLLSRLQSLVPDFSCKTLDDFRENIIEKNKVDKLIQSELTFWEFFLILSDRTNWSDLEGSMREYILSPQIGGQSLLEKHFSIIKESGIRIGNVQSSEDAYLSFFLQRPPFKHPYNSLEDHINFLFEDLQQTEDHFSKYIDDNIDKIPKCQSRYKNNSELIFKIIYSLLNVKSDELFDIYTFNYSTPWNLLKNTQIDNTVNVHGITGGKANRISKTQQIIGINKYAWTPENEASLVTDFIKTNRVSELKPITGATSDNLAGKLKEFEGKYCSISFFGHSLSDIDYPQLFSILDVSNFLSNPSIKLNFFFTNYNGDPATTASGELRTCSEKLIRSYLQSKYRVSDKLITLKTYNIINNQVNFKFIDKNLIH